MQVVGPYDIQVFSNIVLKLESEMTGYGIV